MANIVSGRMKRGGILKLSLSSLRVQLLLLILIVLMPALCMMVYHVAEERKNAGLRVQREALLLLQQASYEHEKIIEEAHGHLELLSRLPEIQSLNRDCSMLLANIQKLHPYYHSIGLATPDGDLIAIVPSAGTPFNLADKSYFQRAIQSGNFQVGGYSTCYTGEQVLPVGYPVIDPHGQTIAFLQVLIDLSWLNELAANKELAGATVTIVDRNGIILASYPDQEKWVGKSVLNEPIIQSILGYDGEGTLEIAGLDGITKLYAFKPLHVYGGVPGLYIYSGVPTGTVYAHVNRLLWQDIIGIGLVFILALALAWLMGNSLILRPIQVIREAVKRFAGGDMSARTGLPDGQGELKQLARSFDKMVEDFEKLNRREELILRSAGEGIFGLNKQGIITFANPAAAKMLGYDVNELVGQSNHGLCHHSKPDGSSYSEEECPIYAAYRDGLVHHITDEVFWKKDGTGFPVEYVSTPVIEKNELVGAVVVFKDVTERRQAEEALNMLYSSAQRLGQSLDLIEQAGYVTRTCVELFGARLAWLGQAMSDGRVNSLTHFPPEIQYPQQIAVRWDDSLLGRGPMGQAIRTGNPVIIADIKSDPDLIPWHEHAKHDGLECIGAFPLISRDKPFGGLAIYSDQPGYFTRERIDFFQAYAHQAAAALENARLYEKAERRIQNVQALRDIDLVIATSLDLWMTLNVVLDQVISQLGIDAANIMMLNSHTQTLEFALGKGFRTKGIERSRLRMSEDYGGRAVFEKRTVNVPNLPEVGTSFLRASLIADENFIAYYGVPLIAKGQVRGLLEIFHRAPLDPDPEWLNFLEVLAGQAAIAIDNAILFEDLQRSNIELKLAYDTTIEGLSYALDLRDKETEGHSRRVTEVTVRLARAMGMGEAELVHVRRGALLHDIGKMGVPDQILLKPGALTGEEWEIMRHHPVYAYEMLAPIEHLRPALDIPYCHHERWDGTGYPRGLKGSQIPLAARIFAVVDVWDALCSERPYRKAWPEQQAIDHIREQAGKHFDPSILPVFLNLLQDVSAEL